MKLTTEQKEVLKELTEVFNKQQIEEIAEGIKNKVDVNIFAKPEWPTWKMYQLREMLEEHQEINFRDINFDLFSEYEIEDIRSCFNELKYNLRDLKEKSNSIEKANEIIKMLNKFINKEFKGE